MNLAVRRGAADLRVARAFRGAIDVARRAAALQSVQAARWTGALNVARGRLRTIDTARARRHAAAEHATACAWRTLHLRGARAGRRAIDHANVILTIADAGTRGSASDGGKAARARRIYRAALRAAALRRAALRGRACLRARAALLDRAALRVASCLSAGAPLCDCPSLRAHAGSGAPAANRAGSARGCARAGARASAEKILTSGRTARDERESPDHEQACGAQQAKAHFFTRKQG